MLKIQVFIHITRNAIANRQVLKRAFELLKDGKYCVTIEAANKRTIHQNAYYHGVIVPLVMEGLQNVGYSEIRTAEDAHETLKFLFLKKCIPNENTGEAIEFIGSTAKLTTTEFNLFIDQIIMWAAEFLGIQIPLPNEQMQLNY